MPIAKRPQAAHNVQPDDSAAEAFISGAEKKAAKDNRPKRKRKERVMIQFDDKVLERVDSAAERRGISRSAWIQYVVSRALDQGEG
jgi:predicted HicB family RNase H-like nuclease